MYTILINNDLSLTTSVKTTLLRNTTTDEIQFLWSDPSSVTEDSVSDDTLPNPQVIVEKTYMSLLRYETDGIMKTESLGTDPEPYKDRVRFYMPRSAAFFSNRGLIQLWLEVTTTTTTTTITRDPDTGEIIDEVTETTTDIFTTQPTTLFIEEVPIEKNCPWIKEDNTIRITRGDSKSINVTLTDDDGFPYEPVEGDEVWFRVKKSAKSENVLIEKSININDLVINLVREDTENLAFGEYRYEIEVITVAQDHFTAIENSPFIITEEL